MLAGEPPFGGATAQAMIARRFTETARPLRTVRETVPEAVEEAVAKALAKAPADRFSTAGEFGRALEASAQPSRQATVATPTPTQASAPVLDPSHRRSGSTVLSLARHRPHRIFSSGRRALRLAAQTQQRWHGPRPAEIKRLAVLPFENLGRPRTTTCRRHHR